MRTRLVVRTVMLITLYACIAGRNVRAFSPRPAPNLPDLRIEGLTATTSSRDAHGLCSVIFHCTVCNRGTATPANYVVGLRGWGTPTIASCMGSWTSGATLTQTAPGKGDSFTMDGPGFHGPPAPRRAPPACQPHLPPAPSIPGAAPRALGRRRPSPDGGRAPAGSMVSGM